MVARPNNAGANPLGRANPPGKPRTVPSPFAVRLAVAAATSLLAVLSLAPDAARAQDFSTWPAEPEWVDLTNQLTRLYDGLVDRSLAAGVGIGDFDPPTLIYPATDYRRFADRVDQLASSFVDQRQADSNSTFATWFATTNAMGQYPTNVPHWTAPELHAVAGFDDWATNSLLSSWMYADHAIQSQVCAAVSLLQWSWQPADWAEAHGTDDTVVVSEDVDVGIPTPNLPLDMPPPGWVNFWPLLRYEGIPTNGLPFEPPWGAAAVSDDHRPEFSGEYKWRIKIFKNWHLQWSHTATPADIGTYNLLANNSFFAITNWAWTGQCVSASAKFTVPDLPADIERQADFYYRTEAWTNHPLNPAATTVIGPDRYYHFGSSAGGPGTTETSVEFLTLSYPGDTVHSTWDFDRGGATNHWLHPPNPTTHFSYNTRQDSSGTNRWHHSAEDPVAVLKWSFDPVPEPTIYPPVETLDTDRDDIVDVGVDASAFGPDTGAILWRPEQEAPEVVIPLADPPAWSAGVSVHERLSQGAFPHLPFHYLVPNDFVPDPSCFLPLTPYPEPVVDNDGYYLASSLNSRVLQSRADSDAVPPIKRVSLQRPRGNIVQFDFPWLGAEFSQAGFATGINTNRTYVLYDVTPGDDTDLFFDLYFDSGVVHRFGEARTFDCMTLPILEVTSEPYTIGPLTEIVNGVDGSVIPMTPGARRYSVTPSWTGDRLTQVTYAARFPASGAITATLGYDTNGLITSISKTGIPGIARANAAYDAASATISNGWGAAMRSQTAGAGTSRTVTITRELTDVGTLAEEFDFNAADRTTARRLTVNGDTAATAIAYVSETGRHANGMLKDAKVERIDHPDGSSVTFGYAPDTGWLTNRSEAIGNGLTRTWTYGYDPAAAEGDTGDPPNATNLVERPRSELLAIDGTEIGRTWFSYSGNAQTVVKHARTAGSAWDDPANLATTNQFATGGDQLGLPTSVRDPIRTRQFSYAGSGDVLKTTVADSGGETRTTWINAFGNVERTVVVENGFTTASAISTSDDFGRILRTDFIDGSFTDNQSWNFLGPPQRIDVDGSAIDYLYYSNGLVKSVARPAFGRVADFGYDPLGNATQAVETAGALSVTNRWSYNALGRLVSATDPLGQTTYSYTEETFGTRMTGTLPDGSTWTEDRHFDGSLKEVSGDVVVAHLRYEYGVEGGRWFEKEIRVGDGGETTEFTRTLFNVLGNPAEIERSGRGGSIVLGEDAAGRLAQRRDEEGLTWNVTYNARGEIQHFGRNLGGAWPLDFTRDRVRTSVRTVDSNGVRRATFVYPQDGAAVSSELSSVTRSLDGLLETVEVDGRTLTSERGPYTSPGVYALTETGGDGARVETEHERWLPTRITRYDATNGVVSEERRAYDGLGFLASVSNSLSGVTTNTPDDARRLVAVDPPGKGPTVFTYSNGTRRVESIATPDGRLLEYEWHSSGLLKRKHGGGQYDVRYEYDSQGRQTRQTTLRDGQPVHVDWTYDPATGRLDDKAAAGQAVGVYGYRKNDQLETYTDAEGQVATYVYNAAGDWTGLTFSDGSPPLALSDIDRLGRARTVSHGLAQAFRFTLDGRATNEVVTGNGIVPDAVLTRVYRPGEAGLDRLAHSVAGGPVRTVVFTQDAAGRVNGLTNGSLSVEYHYRPGAERVEETVILDGGVEILRRQIAWDGENDRPAAVTNLCDGDDVASYTFFYEPESDRIQSVELEDDSSWDYSYDVYVQICTARWVAAGGDAFPGKDFAYRYDSVGNLTNGGPLAESGDPLYSFVANDHNQHVLRSWSNQIDVLGLAANNAFVTVNDELVERVGAWFCKRISVANAVSAVAVPVEVHATLKPPTNALDLVAAVTGEHYVPQADEIPVYADTRVRVGDSRYTYEFNSRQRLTRVTTTQLATNVQLRLRYYADGRRARKEVHLDNGGAWELERVHQFIYDGWNLVHERIDDHSATHNPATPDSSRWREYLWGLDLAGRRTGRSVDRQAAGGVGGLLAVETSEGRTYVPTLDHVGTVGGLIDADARERVAGYFYDPFGVVAATGPAADECPFRFNGKYFDAETGLYYYGQRYYDPAANKWLTPDPIGETGGENDTAFARNDPVNRIDPLGLQVSVHFFPAGGESVVFRTPDVTQAPDVLTGSILTEGVALARTTRPLVQPAAEIVASVLVQGAGEALDAAVIADRNSSPLEKNIAKVSLAIGAATAGIAPNAGAILRAVKRLRRGGQALEETAPTVVREMVQIGDELVPVVPVSQADEFLAQAELGRQIDVLFDRPTAGGIVGIEHGKPFRAVGGGAAPRQRVAFDPRVQRYRDLDTGRFAASPSGKFFHSTSDAAVDPIMKGGFRTDIPNPQVAFHNNRFGRGVYLSDSPAAALAERPGGVVLNVDAKLGRNLNIVNRGPILDAQMGRAIGRGARKHGFDSITTMSVRPNGGINTIIIDPANVRAAGVLP